MSSRANFEKSLVLGFAFTLSVIAYRTLLQNADLQRQLKKQKKKNRKSNKKNEDSTQQDETLEKDDIKNGEEPFFSITTGEFVMKEIGYVESPFPQRAGCPRQGTLAPHVKSRLVLHTSSYPKEVLDGLEAYSHVWVVFAFHLNSRGKAKSSKQRSDSSKTRHHQNGSTSFKGSKIQPPRAPHKMGVLATRSPHRINPVGLSLALLEGIETVAVDGSQKGVCLRLSGLDLVDRTPVYDVKPYVPWDRIPHSFDRRQSELMFSTVNVDDPTVRIQHLKVPEWVSDETDTLSSVSWGQGTSLALRQNMRELEPLYDRVDDATKAIEEIIRQDPRARHDGRGNGGSRDDSIDSFEFTFGRLRISFRVLSDELRSTKRQEERQSSLYAEVCRVQVDEGDISATEGSYPHNLAVRRAAERRKTRGISRPLSWRHTVREGDMGKDLLMLKDGTYYDFLSEVNVQSSN